MRTRLTQPLFQEEKARAHMRHIEKPRMRTRPEVLRHDTFELNRHVITCKRHHFAAALDMEAMKRGFAKVLCLISHGAL